MFSDINKVVSSDKPTSIKKNSLEFLDQKNMHNRGEINLIDSEIKKNSLEYIELEQSIKNFSDKKILNLAGKKKIKANRGLISNITLTNSINVFELEFTFQFPSSDSKIVKNFILNGSINIFRFVGSYSPIKKQVFELEFKSPLNIYDKNGNVIGVDGKANVKDLDLRKLFYSLFDKNYNNIILIETSGEHDLVLDEYSPINFILVRNINGKINIKSKNPITVVSFNSNFKLEYTYENINILTYSELKLLHGDSENKDCPKQSCPECSKQQCPKCIKEDCPKQSCPECSKQQCPECIKEKCPECSKQQCPECIKEKCPECPSNIGWISATTALLIFSIILFSLCLYLKNKTN